MFKKSIFCAIAFLLHLSAFTQNRIIGSIASSEGEMLPGANIYISELKKGTSADQDGRFEIKGIPANMKIRLLCSYVGFSNKVVEVNTNNETLELEITLNPTVIETEEFVVSGISHSTQHDNAIKIEVLNIKEQHNATPNLSEKLSAIPGVDMLSKGSGVAKPVIRGLANNDILILNNGVRSENYQYSSHHPLGIDEFGIDKVEVIKGPASLLYGSDAIGGVVNFIKEQPAAVGKVEGEYGIQFFSNSLGVHQTISIKGSGEEFFGGARIGQQSHADYLQGGGTFVPNTRFRNYSLKTNGGLRKEYGTFNLYYDYGNQRMGLAEEEATELISKRGRRPKDYYQNFDTHFLSTQNIFFIDAFKLDVNGGFQRTGLTHAGEAGKKEFAMWLNTFNYETKLSTPTWNNLDAVVGYQGMYQLNSNEEGNDEILLPNTKQWNNSIFSFINYEPGGIFKFQTGIRYDNRLLKSEKVIEEGTTSIRPALSKHYSSISGSLGLTANLHEKLVLRANIASAYRTPNLAELTSHGAHELRYEVGNASLSPEKSFEADLSLHWHIRNMSLDISGFYNHINDYIYLKPTGKSSEEQLPIYQYTQNDARMFGGEASFHIHPASLKWFHWINTFSAVYGQLNNNSNLPLIPAHKLNMELRTEVGKLACFNDSYLSIRSTNAFKQSRTADNEEPTKGYSLLDMGIGGKIRVLHLPLFFHVGVNNILDKRYVDHLSQLKEVGLYNPGRNVMLSVRLLFANK